VTSSGDLTQVDVVELSIPVQADLVVLARLTAATVASRAGFAVEEIEDLRLAVEELCLSLVQANDSGRLRFVYHHQDDAIEIECTLEPEAGQHRPSVGGRADDLSIRILDALVDEHGRDLRNGRPCAWLRKRTASSTVV
jgi:hypothetical protein